MSKKLFSFIGQKQIIMELSAIHRSLGFKESSGVNLLLSGFAGCGKTKLAKEFLSNFGDYGVQFPSARNKYLMVWNNQCEELRSMFFDEVHLYKNIEFVYPIMDRQEKILVFATNILELPDAFISRCFTFVFDDYSDDEISSIIMEYSKQKRFPIERTVADLLSSFSRGSPRTAKNIFDRACFILKQGYYSKTMRGFSSALRDIGIYEGGFTTLDIKYLQLLQQNRFMSLDSLSRILRINKYTITNEIEPFLISKNKIEITSKGRCLKDNGKNISVL